MPGGRYVSAALVLVTLPVVAAAQGPVQIDWNAPSGCPAADDVRGRIDRLVPASAISTPHGTERPAVASDAVQDALRLRARVDVQRRADGTWRLRVETRPVDGAPGERSLTVASCEAAADAAALIVALALGPLGPGVGAVDTATVVAVVVAPGPPDEPLVWSLGLRAGGAGDYGVFPELSGGAGLAGLVVLDEIRIELGLRYWFGASATKGDEAGLVPLVGTFAMAAGSLVGCWPDSWWIHGCAGMELGRMTAAGEGVERPDEPALLWSAALASLRFGVPIASQWRLVGGLELAVPLAPPAFTFDLEGAGAPRTETIHEPDPVVARGLLGVEVRFR